ncbi:MAG: endonuclease/exonuclease/phosphatase family protein [Bacteroidia bacterium]|nr:endonuclease/exonuclease/phosphatase family protein [Bacteroidia bacterium]
MRAILNFIWYILFWVTILGIASAYLSPEIFWWIAPAGILFPFAYTGLMVLAIFQLIFKQKKTILTLIVLAAGFHIANNYISYSKSRPLKEIRNNHTLAVTSFNSMLFDLYNWFNNDKTRPKIFNTLYEIRPDILCLQEFYTSEEPGDYNNIDSINKLFGLNEFHAEYNITLRNTDHWGIGTFSKYKIVKTGKFDFHVASNNLCIYTDMLIGKDTVRIYNFHLQSYGVSGYINHSSRSYAQTGLLGKLKLWYERVRNGYIERSRQADAVSAHIRSCPYPVIVCGDLNDVPCSYAYRKMRGNLEDAFLHEGFGLGRTYYGKGPRFRIDYIFFSKHFKCLEYQKSKVTFTDHYPITAVFEFQTE